MGAVSGLIQPTLLGCQTVAMGIDSLGACVVLGVGQTVLVIIVALASRADIVRSMACWAQLRVAEQLEG